MSTISNTIQLDSKFEIKNGIAIKNRFFKSAMSEQLGDSNHNPSRGLIKLYETWAEGGGRVAGYRQCHDRS